MIEIIKEGDEAVGVRLQGHEFLADPDSGNVIIPKKFLMGFRLSEIPEEFVIKPVEAIAGNVIEMKKDISIGAFRNGSALAHVEDMGRRKLWDGEVGFGRFMEAMRQGVRERSLSIGDVEEIDFQDDDDYIFLWYDVRLSQDLAIDAAIGQIEKVIGELEERRHQILVRRPDPLLRILDRGSFDMDLARTLERGGTKGRSVCLVLLDLDHFKNINDSYGHQIGDAVLKVLAQILVTETAGKGEAYRYGGEELAVLANATVDEGTRLAEQIRRKVESSEFEAGVKVTVSCGVASYPVHGSTPDELVRAADAALYDAKNSGRNRVVTASARSS